MAGAQVCVCGSVRQCVRGSVVLNGCVLTVLYMCGQDGHASPTLRQL